jgi:hypothetical protein
LAFDKHVISERPIVAYQRSLPPPGPALAHLVLGADPLYVITKTPISMITTISRFGE